MLSQSFNAGWNIKVGFNQPFSNLFSTELDLGTPVTLPHDAMILEQKTPDTKNGKQTGYYPGKSYLYTKMFFVPNDWMDKNIVLEFEGVYPSALVYINGDFAGSHHSGYSQFTIQADGFLIPGHENKIEVAADNSSEGNTRWYSGSGIYRNVNIYVSEKLYIPVNGLQIDIPEIDQDTAVLCIKTKFCNETLRTHDLIQITEILDAEGTIVNSEETAVTAYPHKNIQTLQRIPVWEPHLWDCDSPYLYTCRTRLKEGDTILDEAVSTLGIRKLQLDSRHGLRINGKEVKLRGACIHHDNGIIGAVTLEKAEERRCRQMKEAGFNCLRSSHHAMSKAMLKACDKLGMLVMDELSDMWHIRKNPHDFGNYFEDFWEDEVERMVAKDYNHPSVIMYCTGNEIPEVGTKRGAEMNRRIVERIKSLDSARYTTNAANSFLALRSDMQPLLEEAVKATGMEHILEQTSGAGEGGISVMNAFASLMEGPAKDYIDASSTLTDLLEGFSGGLDIAGFNYITGRHELEAQLHPNRLVLGTETYSSEIVRLWDIVERNSHVIGDFTWTGYDYLGEAGIGIFYYNGINGFQDHNYPDSIAYIGDIDITGYRRPISYLREIVFGLRTAPYLAVERVNHYGKTPGKTTWMHKDNIASWTWDGYEGKPAVVDIFSSSEEVELFLNDISLGRKPAGKAAGFIASYEITYEPGTLMAVSYQNGMESGRDILQTAKTPVKISLSSDQPVLTANGNDLAYVTIGLQDENGIFNLQSETVIHISVDGAGTLQGFGSADPHTSNHYYTTAWNTYDGRLLAAIRSGFDPGEIKITVSADGLDKETLVITVE